MGSRLGVLVEVGGEALGCLGQSRLGFGREDEGDRAVEGPDRRCLSIVLGCACDRLDLGRLLQDHVGVGAADAEGGDAGAARACRPAPRASASVKQLDLPRLPVDFGGGRVDVQGLRQDARRASPCTILITPATPAAAWVWPMLDLIEPSRSGSSRSWP